MLAVIFNPAAGRGRISRADLQTQLARHANGRAFEIYPTCATENAATLAKRALQNGAQIIAAAGGDGTLGEVLNAVHGSGAKLGVLPLGTGNDFARTLGIGTDLELASATLFGQNCRVIDAGRAIFAGESRLFLNVAGCGFDAKVARRINAGRTHFFWRHWKGVAAYLAATALELKQLRAARLRLDLDGEIVDTRALLCAVANARSYGGGMKVAPAASLDDGSLDICLIKEASRIEFARAFPSVFRGEHVGHPRVEMFRARRVGVWCDRPWPVLVDGEVCGVTPLTLEIVPRAVEMMAPLSSG